MKSESLKTAVEEAKRFIARAEDLGKAELEARGVCVLPRNYYCSPKEQGAVKRASMDLTRALAELRKP